METNRVSTPQARCLAAMAACDITPPVGIYHRMWGAASHDKATGVHRPLEAHMLWIEPLPGDPENARVIASLDHCILDGRELKAIREGIGTATGIHPDQVLVTLTHTHGSGWMSRDRSHLPGGDLIGPYLDNLVPTLARLACLAKSQAEPSTLVYGLGRCDMAAQRDYLDPASHLHVCGFNPDGQADETLVVAQVVADSGKSLGTLVNYACHPTTLAWDNTLISPDWVGAMRETIRARHPGPCVFLQGASGDLGPRDGFVGDTAVADRNGRLLGYAALGELESLPQPGTVFCYAGGVTSGTVIGTWKHVPVPKKERDSHEAWSWKKVTVDLPYRPDLPTLEGTQMERAEWLAKETKARAEGNETLARDCRAKVEQCTRQITRLNCLVAGTHYPLEVHLGICGTSLWVFTPGELYQVFQQSLRSRFPRLPMFITTLTNDWQPGYIPPKDTYGKGIYQEVIAATAPGCLEKLMDQVGNALEQLSAQTLQLV